MTPRRTIWQFLPIPSAKKSLLPYPRKGLCVLTFLIPTITVSFNAMAEEIASVNGARWGRCLFQRKEAVVFTVSKSRGFTLIELLVVIGIIVILAALLLPSLSRAKSAADSAVCKSNLRQITLALSMYAQQYNAYPGSQPAVGAFMMSQMLPFVGAPWPANNVSNQTYLGPRNSVYACPGYNRAQGIFEAYNGGLPSGIMSFSSVSYGYNFWGTAWSTAGSDNGVPLGLAGDLPENAYANEPASPLRESRVLRPSNMIAFGDTTFRENQGTLIRGNLLLSEGCFILQTYNQAVLGQPAGSVFVRAIAKRHSGRWNVGFCDCHVENLRSRDLFHVRDPAIAARWNNDNQPHNSGWSIQMQPP